MKFVKIPCIEGNFKILEESSKKIEDASKQLNISNEGDIFTIYVVRHGNGLHNKPLHKKTRDSCLTPLGIHEAYTLGENLKSELSDVKIDDIVVCASYLRRTQHTALALLKGLYDGLPTNFETGLKDFTDETLERCYKTLLLKLKKISNKIKPPIIAIKQLTNVNQN